MAHVFGYPRVKPLRQDLTSLGILMAVPLVSAVLIYSAYDDSYEGLVSASAVSLGLAALMAFSYLKLYPRSLQRIFKSQDFARCVEQDCAVADELGRLKDGWFVFNDIVLELFGVEHLVIGPGGIFVLSKVRHPGPLGQREGVLFAADRPLETLTGKTWRTCHLINILMKKWFKVEHMPQPIIVAGSGHIGDCLDFDGIRIMEVQEIARHIGEAPEVLNQDTTRALVHFVRKRYAPAR